MLEPRLNTEHNRQNCTVDPAQCTCQFSQRFTNNPFRICDCFHNELQNVVPLTPWYDAHHRDCLRGMHTTNIVSALSQSVLCASQRGVNLRSVHSSAVMHTTETISAVCIIPQSQWLQILRNLQCTSHRGEDLHGGMHTMETKCFFSFSTDVFTPKQISPDCLFKSNKRQVKMEIDLVLGCNPRSQSLWCASYCRDNLHGVHHTAESIFVVSIIPRRQSLWCASYRGVKGNTFWEKTLGCASHC